MKVCTDSCLFGAFAASLLNPDSKSILDIGSGAGLLSLMLAQRSMADIEAVEINEDAAGQAADNFMASPWAHRLKMIQSDIRSFTPEKKFDFIISNPPFYEGDLRAEKESINHARHDTGLTLGDLLYSINRLLDIENGMAAILLPGHRTEECILKANEERLFAHEILNVRQTTSHRPFRSIIWLKRKKPSAPLKKEMYIRDDTGEYSAEFRALLKDYYLNL